MKEDRKMEEMTIIPAEAEHAELISVVQLPIIQEQLHTIKAQIEARARQHWQHRVQRRQSSRSRSCGQTCGGTLPSWRDAARRYRQPY